MLDDACWQQTRPLQPFVKLTLGTPTGTQSRAYLLYDDEQLYIGAHCAEPEIDSVKAEVTRRDGPVCGDACIEIFLIPPDSDILAQVEEESRYFHLVVNILGTEYDEIGMNAPKSFDGDWQAAASKGEASWELEVAIPFAELGTRAAEGAVWTGNISRGRWRLGDYNAWTPLEYSTWAPIQRTFHDKSNFGQLVFTSNLVAIQEEIERIELAALKSGLLRPGLDEIAACVASTRQQVQRLPDNCKPTVAKPLTITSGRLHRLAEQVQALTPADFRSQWEYLYRKIERLCGDAEVREDEALMLAATDGGQQPWYIFVSKAITNQRLLSNRWPREVKSLPKLSLIACPREYESATFSVYATRDLQNVQLEVSDLRCGEHTLPASCIDPYVVKCWYQAGGGIGDLIHKQFVPELLLKDDALVRVDTKEEANYLRSTAADGATAYLLASGKDSADLEGVRPIDAPTLQPVTIPANTLKQFWVTVHIPQDAAAGRYTGSLRLLAPGITSAEVPLAVTVLPFELAAPDLIYSIYYRGKLTGDGHGTISSEGKSEAQYRAEMRDLRAHGVLYPTLYQGYHHELLPRTLELRREAGLASDILFTLGRSTGNVTSEDALNSLKSDVKKWRELAAKFGYKEVYFYGIDEASGERLKSQQAAWEAVQAAGGKTFVAGYAGSFEAMGSRLSLLVWAHVPLPEEAEKWHSVGSKIFNYANPQVGVEEPETYRRNFGILLWKAGYDGAMDYAYQHGFGHVWNDFDSPRYRDHNFSYPTISGIVGTIQWEGFREGVDDVRYITTLEKAIAAAGDTEPARQAQRWLDNIAPSGDLPHIRGQAIWWIKRLMR